MGVPLADLCQTNKVVGNAPDVFPSSEDVGALVLDLGQLYVRAGNAGDDVPKFYAYSMVGENMNHSVTPQTSNHLSDSQPTTDPLSEHKTRKASRRFPVSFTRYQSNLDVAPCLYQPSKQYDLNGFPSWESVTSPIEALELDKEGFQSMIAHIFGVNTGLNVDLKGKPLLFSDPNKHNRKLRESMAEILFETFSVEALYAAKKAVLTAFAVGRSSGLVIDIGKEFTSLAPVQEGYIVQNRVLELPLSGDLMDYQLSSILQASGKNNIIPLYKVKKKVRLEPDLSFSVESYTILENLSSTASFDAYSQRELLRQMKEAVSIVSEDPIVLSHFSSFMENLKSSNCSLFSQTETVPFTSQQRFTLPGKYFSNSLSENMLNI